MILRSTMLAILALLMLACAGRRQAAPVFEFPSRAELEAIPGKNIRKGMLDMDAVRVESWTYEPSSMPSVDGPYEDASPWNRVLVDAIREVPRARIRLSAALRCTADQSARFALKYRKRSDASWQKFTASRCGSTALQHATFVWGSPSEASEGVSETALAARFRADVGIRLAASLAGTERLAAGLAIVREGGQVAVGIVVARERVRIEKVWRDADRPRTSRIDGTLLDGDDDAVSIEINQGKYGYGTCARDVAVPLPNFSFSCQMAEEDKWAWIDLITRRRGRGLRKLAGTMLVVAKGEALPHEYVAPGRSAPSGPAGTPDEFRRSLTEQLNRARLRANLAPVQLAMAQSVVHQRLAGVVIGGLSEDNSLADRASLGLLAGWEVKGGLIRNGHVLVAVMGGARSASVWLDDALEHPMGRATLLDPSSRAVAIGSAMVDSEDAVGAVVTTHSFFEGMDHRADADRIFSSIYDARERRGLKRPIRLVNVPLLEKVFKRVRANEMAPDDVPREIMAGLGKGLPGVRGLAWVFYGSNIDELKVPSEFLEAGPMGVAVEVTHYHPRGAPWGEYIVFLVVLNEDFSEFVRR